MLAKLKKLLTGDAKAEKGQASQDPLHLAAAALLVEAARMDDDFSADERSKISDLLAQRFELGKREVEGLIADAEAHAEDAVEIYSLTREIKNSFSEEERVELIGMLWEVAYMDGVLHDFEAALMRRLAGLLYVSDKATGTARKAARKRLGIEKT